MRNNRLLLALTAAAFAVPAAASAQNAATIQAQAVVLDPITVTAVNNLDFGDVIPGFPVSIAPGDATGGVFQISGGTTAEVDLDFGTLPGVLNGPSGATMPIGFAAGDAGYGPNSTTVAGTFDPGAGTQTNLSSGALFVFLGGTVTPAAVQTPGSYSADVTLTVTYTGN